MLEYFRHKYPYTDFHELNLDWFLGEFKAIMDRVDAIDVRLTQAEADIDELQAEVLDLNERVQALSEALNILTNRVDNAEEDIVDLQNRLATAEGSISNLLSRMTEVETAVASVTARVTTAENDIDTLGTDLSALTTRVDTAEDDIDALETRVGSDESSISGLDNRLTTAENTLATKSTVTITPTLQSGTKVADYTINGTNGSLYAPTGSGGGGIANVTGSNSATVTVANDVANVDVSYITTGKASGTTPAMASTVEGENNTVTGAKGHAEGTNNTVGAPNSHAEGYGNTTTANNSHVGGNNSVAGGVSSFAHGDNTKTTNAGECAVGSFNVSDNMTRFSVGGGTADNNRKNLFEVTSSGSAMVSGELHTEDDVYIGGQNIYINNANDVQKELSIDANNQLCIDSVPVTSDEFVFTITPPSLSDGMRIESSSDKTASEIIAAYNDGKTILGVMKFNQQDYFFNLISNVAGSPVTKITISGFNSDRTLPSFYELAIDSGNGSIQIGWSPSSTKARICRFGDLPVASANDLGGIKVGSGLSIDGNGVLSASGGGSTSEYDEIIYFTTEFKQMTTSGIVYVSSTNCSHTMAEFYNLVASNKKIGGVIVDNLTNKTPMSFISPLFKPLYQSYKYYFKFEGSLYSDADSVVIAANDNDSAWYKVGSDLSTYRSYTNAVVLKARGLNSAQFIPDNYIDKATFVFGGVNDFATVPSDMTTNNTFLTYLESRGFGILWGDNTEYYYTCRGRGNVVWTKHFFDSSILVSPNNTQYRIKVDDNGVLSTELVQ